MSNVSRLAIVDPNDATRESLKSILMGMDSVWLEADCSRYEFFLDVAKETAPDLCLIVLDSNPEQALQLLVQTCSEVPGTVPLVASSSTDGQLILKAMRSGAREFLTLPMNHDELLTALQRVSGTHAAHGSSKSRRSEMIAVAGATGGVGTTSAAVNIACFLAADPNHSVALVDLDLTLGDADIFLDTIPEYTLADVCHDVSRLDMQMLKRSLTKHQSGVYLLPRPVELHDAQNITADVIRKVLALMKSTFTHVVVDLSKSYSEMDLAAMEMSSEIILVTQLDLPCLRNVVRLLMSFDEVDGLRSKTRIVVNRSGLDSGQISLRKAKETIGREIFAQLPNDYRTMVEVRNNGVPLMTQAPKAPITQAYRDLMAKLAGSDLIESEAQDSERSAIMNVAGSWKKFWPGQKS